MPDILAILSNLNISALFDSFLRLLNRAIRICFLDAAIWVLSDTCSIREEYVFLTTCIFNSLNTILLNPLNGTVCKYALFFTVCEDTFDRAVGEYDFFCTIREMLLDLAVREFEDLKSICIGCLSGFGLSKIVNNLCVGICLLDVVVIEIDYCISIRERFSSYTVRKDHFLFAIQERPLNFAIVSNNLLLNSCVIWFLLIMIHVRELHLVIFLLILFILIFLHLNLR